ncbi:hypothetical protein [Nocardioides sp.]|uniref:hypothetical protein n=1 Tax=Nocardioides sp. TaxID=35761 RepID=UPI002620C209|nr:hypothetical protein [Nocardioides sp.]MCW2738850.1 hypothetical protein [Nocardioides sp.]
MDWATLGVSLGSAVLSGGIVGGLVSLKVSSRETRDRQAALTLEREKWQAALSLEQEKWEHERDKPRRAAQREALSGALTAVSRFRQYIFDCNKDPEERHAIEGEFHKVRVMVEELDRAGADLLHHDLTAESEGVLDLRVFATESWQEFDEHYSAMFYECLGLADALEARLARTYE